MEQVRMNHIAAAFVKAQKEFGPALKTKSNPHLKSKYADLASCVEAVIDALNNNGIALMQHTHDCDNGVIVETVFLHESGEVLSTGRLHVPAVKADPQGYGSALTYCRRYALMTACGIAPEDDDGQAASKPQKAAFDIEAANKAIQAAKTLDELQAVWNTQGAIAMGAKDRDGYASLKALVSDRKAVLEGKS
jgi:hypothetical protein